MAGAGWGGHRFGSTALAQPAFVQLITLSRTSHEASWRFLMRQVQIAGNANAAVLGCNDTIAQISSLTEAAVNAYQLAIGPTTNALVRILIKNLPPSLEANRDTSSEIQELFRNINHIATADVGRAGRLPT
jgi:hypothetical protein